MPHHVKERPSAIATHDVENALVGVVVRGI
jgi:hypothetical protein